MPVYQSAIRPALESDYSYFLDLYPDLQVDQAPPNRNTWVKYDMQNAYIITMAADPVGYIWIKHWEEVLYLTIFVIGKEYHGKGIGTETLIQLQQFAKNQGFRKIGLHCDVAHTTPHSFYVKVGMQPTGKLFHLKVPANVIRHVETVSSLQFITGDNMECSHKLEHEYGLFKGQIKREIDRGSVVVRMLSHIGEVKGFASFKMEPFRLTSLVVESSDDLVTMLSLLNDLRGHSYPHVDWIHLWVSKDKKYAEIIFETFSTAVCCEEFDYLEMST
jgi:GNAT superfamily N-acetyltransferase